MTCFSHLRPNQLLDSCIFPCVVEVGWRAGQRSTEFDTQGSSQSAGPKKPRLPREVITTRVAFTMAPKKKHSASTKVTQSKPTPASVPSATADGCHMDSLGFFAMDSNIPGLSQIILKKLNMRNFEEYRAALDGNKTTCDFGIHTYFDMFQKIEDTFKFCAECKKLPGDISDSSNLRRCKRCQNVYYCDSKCQRANWPLHKKFCKKLELAATDRLVEWLIFTGDIPFPTSQWVEPIMAVKSWDDWFAMQDHLEEKLGRIMTGRNMNILWSNAGFHASQGLTEGWLPTLLLLRDYRLPSIFTMYNELELKYSLQILAELEFQILSHGPNPFASLRVDQVQSNPNKHHVHSNAYQVQLFGAEKEDNMEDLSGEAPGCQQI
ncbi:putative protein MSS51 homolog, mitochondrial isoform X4 [Ambystoma mexicanum]|uniref:putative protein MSS51 homolog, mitochondrial isoform X4 n=1 Tax=Ambystoma mexicanum TaxID=8296 RepID=UPI0037E8AE66